VRADGRHACTHSDARERARADDVGLADARARLGGRDGDEAMCAVAVRRSCVDIGRAWRACGRGVGDARARADEGTARGVRQGQRG
jgi:hypothetical protein